MMTMRWFAAALLAGAAALSGCATRVAMPLERDAELPQAEDRAVFLMTATLRNRLKPRYQPKLETVQVERTDGSGRLSFSVDDKARAETDHEAQGNHYFLRLTLAPGEYEITGLGSTALVFPATGHFYTPVYSPLKVVGPGVYYLGHIEATLRERGKGEFPAGSAIPMFDQLVVGALTGSFDIRILDSFYRDESAFRNRFPSLKDAKIEKAVLPPFDRAKAQAKWEQGW